MLLNEALTITQDAITGFWDGTPNNVADVLARLPAADDLTGLDPARRIDMLVAELLQHFRVSGTASGKTDGRYVPGNATVEFNGEPLAHLQAPDTTLLEEQLVWLRNYADLRIDRLAEINLQVSDLLSFFGAQAQLDAAARKRSLELMTATLRVAYLIGMRVKTKTWTPRPIDLSLNVQPAIQTPDHSSFPSGHAVESFALAVVLMRMMGGDPFAAPVVDHIPLRLAHRIASNRTIAGVHFPIDNRAGAYLGAAIGDAIWATVSNGTRVRRAEYDPNNIPDPAAGSAPDTRDFLLSTWDFGQRHTTGHKDKRGPVAEEYHGKIVGEWGAP